MQHPGGIEKFAYAARRVTRILDNRDGTTTEQTGGTAFIVAHPQGDRSAGYMVTANHVIWPRIADASLPLRKTIGLRLDSHERSEGRSYDYTQIELDTSSWTEKRKDGVSVFLAAAVSGMINGGYSSFVPSADLWTRQDFEEGGFIGRGVVVAGYPDSILPDSSVPRPVISSGAIASDPRWTAGVARNSGEHSVLYQGFSWSGMSGAPVMAEQVGLASSASIQFSGHLARGVIGVSFGHVSSTKSSHSSWSGLFPSWLILDALSELTQG